MPEKHEDFRNITAGIQSTIFAVALIVGGIWTVYTFSILGTREKAQAELDKQKEEQSRQASFGLDISINAKQEQLPGIDGYFISALVKITNKSNQNRFIDFSEAPLRVAFLQFDEQGQSTSSYTLEQKNINSDSEVLRTAATVEYPFLVKVQDRGFYIISYSVKLNKAELEIHRKSGGPDGEEIYWGGDTYLAVK